MKLEEKKDTVNDKINTKDPINIRQEMYLTDPEDTEEEILEAAKLSHTDRNVSDIEDTSGD